MGRRLQKLALEPKTIGSQQALSKHSGGFDAVVYYCLECGGQLHGKRNARYCSPKCRVYASRKRNRHGVTETVTDRGSVTPKRNTVDLGPVSPLVCEMEMFEWAQGTHPGHPNHFTLSDGVRTCLRHFPNECFPGWERLF